MAQPNIFGVTEFDQDPETAAELMRLRKQQQIADAMMGQSQQPLQGGMAGNVYVAPSITQGLAKLFQGYSAGRQSSDVMDQYKKLANDRRAMEDSERSKVMEALIGRSEQPMGPPTEAGEMGVSPARPAGTKEQVMQALAASRLPAYRDAGLKGMIAESIKGPDWEVVEQYDASGNKQKVLLNKNNPAQTRPFGGASAPTIQYKEVFVEGPKGEPYVQKQVSTDNGKTWTKEGVASPRFAKQVASTVVVGGDEAKYAPVSVVKRGPDGKDDPKLGTELISRAQAIKEKRTLGSSDPTIQGGIAGAKQEGEAKAKRALNMAGLGETIDTAKSLLSGTSGKALPTGSATGTLYDTVAGWVGASPEGAKEAQTMKAIGGALTSKMPRMEGPQSDKDTQLYKEMAAVVGDSMIPRERRLAALAEVERLWGKYETGATKSQSGSSGLSPQEQAELDQLRARFGKK